VLHSHRKVGSRSALKGTFPERGDPPTCCKEGSPNLRVILDIAPDLGSPKVLSGGRPFKQMAVVLMPETAIYENDGPVPRENQIGLARQVFRMQPVAQPSRMQRAPNQQFRLRMATSDGSHIPAARSLVVNVRQGSGGFAPLSGSNQRLNMRLHDACYFLKHRHRHRIPKLLIRLRV